MSEDREQFVDVMVSAVLHADDHELVEDAATAGEDLTSDGEQLRARFLERVARARELGSDSSSEAGELDRVEPPLPSKIGRYPIQGRLGAGGMGVVYAAYDEALDRRLAIKVLQDRVWDSDGRRRDRLIREAQAMARVTHPNLVTVHEVGGDRTQLFVAMEFVSGPTLKQWLVAERRSWREIVAVFIQIAEGLAALHDAGLVHRDVKPANVIIGDDGRVRVLDLGLVGAKPSESIPTEGSSLESSSMNRLDEPLTMTGERLGTPAYMSREQFLGLELTPASDIFSFSVVLYEALFGSHPFVGKNYRELQAKVVDNRFTPPSSSAVPAWLTNLVIRGFSPNPKDRPPSMRAYAVALARDPSRVRRRIFATCSVAVTAALAGVVFARTPTTEKPCDGAESQIAEVWNETRAGEIHQAMIATDRPYAPALAKRITEDLDEYAENWAEAHGRICAAHQRGDHSAILFDARMACLDLRRQALSETVSLLVDADADLVDHAGQMVAKLPRLEPCNDLSTLRPRAPWMMAGTTAAVDELESKLVRVEAFANGGKTTEAIELAREVAREAQRNGDQPMLAAALLAEARASIVLTSDRSATAEVLNRALEIAVAEKLDLLAAEAMIRRIYVRAGTPGFTAAALDDLRFAEAMLTRSGGDADLRALFWNNAGTVYIAAGDRERARAAIERSLEIKEDLLGADHLEVALGLVNLAILTTDELARHDLLERIIHIYEERLGPDHPLTLDARSTAAHYIADPAAASAALSDVCPRLLAIDKVLGGECEFDHGRLEFARERFDEARLLLTSARKHLAADDERRVLLDAYLALGTGTAYLVIRQLRDQIAKVDERGGDEWWLVLSQAEHRLLLAWLVADSAAAVELLEVVIRDLERIVDQAPAIERERLLALSRSTLARELTKAGDSDGAHALATDACNYYQRWGRDYDTCLAELLMLSHPPSQ